MFIYVYVTNPFNMRDIRGSLVLLRLPAPILATKSTTTNILNLFSVYIYFALLMKDN